MREVGLDEVFGNDRDRIGASDVGAVKKAASLQGDVHDGEVRLADEVDADGHGFLETSHIEFEGFCAVWRNSGDGGCNGFDGGYLAQAVSDVAEEGAALTPLRMSLGGGRDEKNENAVGVVAEFLAREGNQAGGCEGGTR